MDSQNKPALTGVRKRQQIEMTNKRIFLWLAASAVIISFCIVALQFLVREFMFNQKIISAKSKTNQQLVENVTAANKLTENVKALLANTNLSSLKADPNDPKSSNLSVVLDALPVNSDPTGFASSLQTVVLPLSGVSIRELSTSNIDDASLTEQGSTMGSNTPSTLPFKAGFNGTYPEVQKALVDMARVIRPINLTELGIVASDEGKLQVTVAGVTYYLPARSIDVRTEVLKP